MYTIYLDNEPLSSVIHISDSSILPRIGDTICMEDKEYTVRKVIFYISPFSNKVSAYQVHVSEH